MRKLFAIVAMFIGLPLMAVALAQILTGGLRVEASEAYTISFLDSFILVFLLGWTIYTAGSILGIWLILNRWIRSVSDYYAGVHEDGK